MYKLSEDLTPEGERYLIRTNEEGEVLESYPPDSEEYIEFQKGKAKTYKQDAEELRKFKNAE